MVQKHDNILKSFMLFRHIYQNEEILLLMRNPTYKFPGEDLTTSLIFLFQLSCLLMDRLWIEFLQVVS